MQCILCDKASPQKPCRHLKRQWWPGRWAKIWHSNARKSTLPDKPLEETVKETEIKLEPKPEPPPQANFPLPQIDFKPIAPIHPRQNQSYVVQYRPQTYHPPIKALPKQPEKPTQHTSAFRVYLKKILETIDPTAIFKRKFTERKDDFVEDQKETQAEKEKASYQEIYDQYKSQ